MRSGRWLIVAVFAIAVVFPFHQSSAEDERLWVGPNINMVSGTTWPDGDPFLQRQNEPSIAVSTRSLMRLMGFANDYRSVDIPGLPVGKETGDAWLGVFKSFDGGLTWRSTLLPGYLQDQGSTSPLHGYEAAADPVVRAGTHGLFYLSGIVFDRGDVARSAVFVTRYMDLDNREAGDPIEYVGTTVVKANSAGDPFIDKPWMAVDVPRANAQTVQLTVEQDGTAVQQTVQCGNVYLAWTEFQGTELDQRSTIMLSRSTDCGATWSEPVALSAPGSLNQGAMLAVSPATGDVWAAWRQVQPRNATLCALGLGYWKGHPEAWPLKRLSLGGVIYDIGGAIEVLESKPKGDATVILAHQLIAAKLNVAAGATAGELATTVADADAWLVVHPIGSDPGGDERAAGVDLAGLLSAFNNNMDGGCSTSTGSGNAIVATLSTDGGRTFSAPTVVAPLSPFDQNTTMMSFRTNSYPTLTVDGGGRAYLAWAARGLAVPRMDVVEGDARVVVSTSLDGARWMAPRAIDQPQVPGHQLKPSLAFAGGKVLLSYLDLREDYSGLFERFIADWPSLEHYRHTVDVRVAAAEPADVPVFTDYSLIDPPPAAPLAVRPSDRLSRYLFVPYPTDPEAPEPNDVTLRQFQFNPPNLPIFVGGTMPFFGDYIDIAPSPPFLPDGAGGWRFNTGPGDGAVVHAVWTDNRDVEAPADGNWSNYVVPTQGGASVFDPTQTVPDCGAVSGGEGQTRIRNQNIYTARVSHGLTVASPGGARAPDAIQRAFVVFVRNDTRQDRAFRLAIAADPDVNASFEQFMPLDQLDVEIPGFSSASRTVFVSSIQPRPDVRVTVLEIDGPGGAIVFGGLAGSVLLDPDHTSPAPADPGLEIGETHDPAMMNAVITSLAMMNPAMMNPAMMNPAMMNQALYALAMMNPAMMNPAMMNLAMMNPAMMNLALANLAMMNPAMMNPAMMNPAMMNLAMMNPAMMNPAMMNLAMMNPAMMNLAMMNPAMMNASLSDVTWEVTNEGNTAGGYSFNMLMQDPPASFVYQLLIYRLYKTPVADGCELTEEAQQELLVNIMDPALLSSPPLDPGTSDPEATNATFWMEPGETVYATLRVIDPNAEDDIVFDPSKVTAAVVAEAVNTADAAAGETQPPYVLQPSGSALPLAIVSSPVLPTATQAAPYSFTLAASGGTGALTWTLATGSTTPEGLALDPATGVLSGIPSSPGLTFFTVEVTDSAAQVATQTAALTVTAAPVMPLAQRNALIALYDATNGAGWTDRTSWRNAGDTAFNDWGTECTWYGVTCDAGGTTVMAVDLAGNNLAGPIPPELEQLDGLQVLNLRGNPLTGPIPPEIGNIVSLDQLDLGYAGDSGGGLSGAIPAELGNLGNLTRLALDTNLLTGNIPAELGDLTNLQHLDLSVNQLAGSIPPELGDLASLQYLNLHGNQLTGSIPAALGSLSNLQFLYLSLNQLVGSIPPELATLSNLQILYLSTNQLTGSIPPELGNLSNLTWLDLADNELDGSVPPELGGLSNLRFLYLSSNPLSGSIPWQLGNLASLQALDLRHTQISGGIPPELGNLASLRQLHLGSNQLSGGIPPELGSLSSLLTLDLDVNQLTGSIPPELGNLSGLRELRLAFNHLNGAIPTELGGLSSLEQLNISGNQLGGAIPAELGNLSNLQVFDLSRNRLDAEIPVELANLTGLVVGQTDIRWNALVSADAGLTAFLASRQVGGDWQSTQTVAPDDLAAGPATADSVTLSWTPIAYTADGGGYEALYATSPGGPYATFGRTADKSATSIVVDGLTPDTTYHFAVRTVTDPHSLNQNTVVSGLTAEVSSSTAPPVVPLAQRNALIALYDSTNGAGWTDRTNWRNPGDTDFNDPGTECTWHGITCDVLGNVTAIGLSLNNLTGTIPSDLEQLTALQLLDLGGNSLTGSIPAEIGNIVSLQELELGYAGGFVSGGGLTGTIPASLGSLTNLRRLALYENALTGTIPPELGSLSNLEVLEVYRNELSGSIPPELGNLSSLRLLYMGMNQLSGTIPVQLGNLLTLGVLDISYNQLSGGIPAQLGDLPALRWLLLNDNQLSGSIPPELGNLSNLQHLNVASNELTGTIPAELGSLSNLLYLQLSSNQLTGTIPPELGDLSNLEFLNLFSNQLNGSIPASLGSLSSLQHLALDHNQLSGVIPVELGSLSNLRNIQFAFNQLSGGIPPELGDLSSLEGLNLFSNQLTGNIPPELGSPSNLQWLNLSANQLTGSIPPQLGNLASLERLWLGSNQLSGSLPAELGNLTGLQELYLNGNQLRGMIPPELGNLSNLNRLYLQGNQLDSLMPMELANLISIVPGQLDIRWNALLSPNAALTTFLNVRQVGGDWQSTQTMPPSDFAASPPTSSSITLSWTPITYTADGGGYEAYYATAPGGPYTTFGRTADKTVTSIVVDGLAPGTTYYLHVQTVTDPHSQNQNTVFSNTTGDIVATTSP